jgi:hypothetical protein
MGAHAYYSIGGSVSQYSYRVDAASRGDEYSSGL